MRRRLSFRVTKLADNVSADILDAMLLQDELSCCVGTLANPSGNLGINRPLLTHGSDDFFEVGRF
jgi:hypothetical protein